MRQKLSVLSLLAMTACLSDAAFAQAPAGKPAAAPAAEAKADPRAAIAKKFDGIKVEDIRVSPVNGIYEITRGSEISYVSADG